MRMTFGILVSDLQVRTKGEFYMSKKELLAMLLAGGQGSRLYDLTKDVA